MIYEWEMWVSRTLLEMAPFKELGAGSGEI